MKITLGKLRRIIYEEVFRNYLWSAGISPSGLSSQYADPRRKTPRYIELGLTTKDAETLEDEEQDGKEQEKLQLVPRINDERS